MNRSLSVFALALMGSLAGTPQTSHAQTSGMSLRGSVQTDAREPLSGADITVIHLPSGSRRAASSDATGRFAIPNLLVGGPYIIQVGEGGYRPQTVQNIFLQNGKTADFTVTLSKLTAASGKGKARSSRAPEANGSTLTLAPEAEVGGPILMTTMTAGQRPAAAANPATAAGTSASVATPQPVSTPAAEPAAPSRYARSSRYSRRTSPAHTDPIVPGHYDAKTGNYIYETGALTTLKLANGAVISAVGINSTESYLFHFITDPKVYVDTIDLTNGWYNFDKVFFDTGKATLTPESIGQLRNIATLLRAYPQARIKLGGYTDNTGDYKVNRQLSEARARTAWASLVEMGVSPARLEARGYGPNYAIAANESDEGRAQNRRLSVKVLQK